jgi:hypothetical protein
MSEATNKPDANEQQRKAGEARAAAMSAKERKALATKGAHARWKRAPDGVAIASHAGTVKLPGFELPCAVLQDGRGGVRRIFSERGLSEAFTHVRSGSEFRKRREQPEEAPRLPVFINDTVAAYLAPAALERLSKPVRYRMQEDNWAIPAWGVDAELLADICDAYLAAREDGALRSAAWLRKAAAAEKLTRALAKVGVAALIDEATGFQVERDREELQRLLAKYVTEEFRPWTSMYPTAFYAEMFRLRNITTDDVRKRPAYFGKLTNNIVYDRLMPGMLERLKEVNPSDENGRRARKHHQHLTNNVGVQHLREHLSGLLFLMRSSNSWDDFMRRLDRAAPRRNETLALPYPESETDDAPSP